MGKLIDLTGQRFGRLVVLKRSANNNAGQVIWLCKCDCGNDKKVSRRDLRGGRTKSCGCLALECRTKHNHSHADNKSPTYNSWDHMIQRCTNPNNHAYHNYGGRGIKIYKPWLKFQNFLKDMGERPKSKMLDRIDNDGNYEPENCRWITHKEQQRNKRNNRLFTIKGESHCLIEWCEKLGLSYKKVEYRIRNGWDIEEAFDLKPTKRRKTFEINIDGIKDSLRGWCRRLGLCTSTVRYRLSKGQSIIKALGIEIEEDNEEN